MINVISMAMVDRLVDCPINSSTAMDDTATIVKYLKHDTMVHVTMNQKIIKVCCSISVDVKHMNDEKIIDYDPNDQNLVDEPHLDVENPYEGLGPGRSDPISRALISTAGRQSPDSIGHGKTYQLFDNC
jgi:hypothetical protein